MFAFGPVATLDVANIEFARGQNECERSPLLLVSLRQDRLKPQEGELSPSSTFLGHLVQLVEGVV